jgi:hypothetical protein
VAVSIWIDVNVAESVANGAESTWIDVNVAESVWIDVNVAESM